MKKYPDCKCEQDKDPTYYHCDINLDNVLTPEYPTSVSIDTENKSNKIGLCISIDSFLYYFDCKYCPQCGRKGGDFTDLPGYKGK